MHISASFKSTMRMFFMRSSLKR